MIHLLIWFSLMGLGLFLFLPEGVVNRNIIF